MQLPEALLTDEPQFGSGVWSVAPTAHASVETKVRSAIEAASAGRSGRAPDYSTVVGDVAIIPLQGPMLKFAGILERYGFTSSRRVQWAIERAAADPKVEKILLWIDSPGGSVDGLAELGDAVRQAAKVKEVIAQVDGMAASAAYYAAAQATRILMGRTDMVGSIGTRLMLYDFSAAFEKAGIKAIPIDTGKYKSAGAPGTAITEDQRADFQRVVDTYFADFRGVVSRGRKLPSFALDEIADGRVFIGREAIIRRLADGIATMDQTLAHLRRNSPEARRRRNAVALAMARLRTTQP